MSKEEIEKIEEIQDYFLEIYDNIAEGDENYSKVQITIDSRPFISVRYTSKPRRPEIILESVFNGDPICRQYNQYESPCSTNFKVISKVIEYPITRNHYTVNEFNVRITYPKKISKKIENIINTSINRLNISYDISDKIIEGQKYINVFSNISKEIKFKLVSKNDHQTFKKIISENKDTHQLDISNYASGIDNYYTIETTNCNSIVQPN